LSIIIAILNSHRVVVRQIRHFKNMRLPKTVEIIFVDDGSNPPLYYQNCGLRNFKILFTNDKRPWTQGLARNMGAKEAKGEYLFFTDIDHIITREAIDDVLKFDGDRMMFIRYYGILDRNGNIVSDAKSMLEFGLDPSRVRTQRGFMCGGMHGNTYAIKKNIFYRIGGYDPRDCQLMFHTGADDRRFNNKYNDLTATEGIQNPIIGSKIYFYPVGKFRTDGDNNPFGLFHGLSLEQVPQPMLR